jgi:hypothetical protein
MHQIINLKDIRSIVCLASGTEYTHAAANKKKTQAPTEMIDSMVALMPIAWYQHRLAE